MGTTKVSVVQVIEAVRSNTFAKNVTNLFVGDLSAQVVGFLSIFLLSRLYGPEAFGLLGVFVALTEVFGRVSTLRYDTALVLPEADEAAWGLLRFTALICLVFSMVLLFGAYPFRDSIADILGTQLLADYFPWIALMVLGIGYEGLGISWSMRLRHFKAIGQSSATASVLGNGIKILAGAFGFGPGGLLVGTVAQRWIRLLILGFKLPSSERRQLPGKLEEGARQAKIHADFPVYRMPQDVLNMLTRQLPSILLASFFSPVAAGFYILATRVLQLPFEMLQTSVRRVFYVRAVEVEREGASLFRLSFQLSVLIALAMLPIALVLFLFGEALFELICGAEWSTSGMYAKWVILFLLFNFTSVPVSAAIPVVGMNRFFLVFEITSMVLSITVITFVAMTWSADATVVAISMCSSLSSLLLTIYILWHLRARELKACEQSN